MLKQLLFGLVLQRENVDCLFITFTLCKSTAIPTTPSLEEAIAEAVDGLNKTAAERFEKIWDINDKKIQLKCGEVQRQLEVYTYMYILYNVLYYSLMSDSILYAVMCTIIIMLSVWS